MMNSKYVMNSVRSSYTLVEGNDPGVSTQEFLLIEHFFMHDSIMLE